MGERSTYSTKIPLCVLLLNLFVHEKDQVHYADFMWETKVQGLCLHISGLPSMSTRSSCQTYTTTVGEPLCQTPT